MQNLFGDFLIEENETNQTKEEKNPFQNGLVTTFVTSVFGGSACDEKFVPGRGILQLNSKFSFLIHMAYSLLKGRVLIVYGDQEHAEYVSK